MKQLLFVLLLLLVGCATPAKDPATTFPDPAVIGARDEFARPPYPTSP